MGLVNSYQAQQFGQYLQDESVVFMMHVTANKIIEELDVADIDIDVAQQYSDVYRTPWSDNKILVQKFLDTHRSTIEFYVFNKCVVAVQEAMEYLKKFSNKPLLEQSAFVMPPTNNGRLETIGQSTVVSDYFSRISPIPLTTAMIDQLELVLNRLSLARSSGSIDMNSIDVELQGDIDSIAHMFKVYHNTMYIDRPRMTDDGGVYLDSSVVDKICDTIRPILLRMINSTYRHSVYFEQLKVVNALVGVILSCYTVEGTKGLSVSEEEFYQRYVTKSNTRACARRIILPMVRPFSSKSPLYAINMPLRTNTTDKSNSMKNIKSGVTSSLSERYLVYYVTNALCHPNDIKSIPMVKRV